MKAVKKELSGPVRKRCKVHFMMNILARIPHRDKARMGEMGEKLKQIWLQPERHSAEKVARLIIEEYKTKYPEAMSCLEEGLEDSRQGPWLIHGIQVGGRALDKDRQAYPAGLQETALLASEALFPS
ncbi:MAG: transposase [Candidatus Aminicenantes bacterium]|nr:transposase [Candidatus Aminicenantes bacterium]